MENASKALLIAGAILIAILLIGVGMMVFNSIDGFAGQAEQQTDSMRMQAFNSKFEQYEGIISGSKLKALIRDVNSNNVLNVEDESMQVTMSGDDVKETQKWSDGKPTTITGTVKTNARYNVQLTKDATGYVKSITITKK